MGKPTGFLEFDRVLPAKEAPDTRRSHYREFTGRWSDAELNRQTARCMNCGIPFCHSGCPLGNVIPEFNDAAYRGDMEEALSVLLSTNPFPEFTGRVCPAPCESACVLGIHAPAVAIEEIEKTIIETAFERGWMVPRPPAVRTGKRVAVIGSGPAGLSAAASLNSAGHSVTVFERAARPGGLLRYGIPDFKLAKGVVERRIRLMEGEGIEFRCGVEVGKGYSVRDLMREFSAVVLATGSTVPRDLPVGGRQLEGVHFAMDYLGAQNRRIGGEQGAEGLTALGADVVVIGGGDTGSDCVGTAHRQGARSVTQFELLPQPPAGRTDHMPWPQYPMILKTTTSHEEGGDRHWAVATKEFLGDERGKLRALKVVDLEWTSGQDGRPAHFTERPGSEREVPCTLALLAMGFTGIEREGVITGLGLEVEDRGTVRAGEDSYTTSLQKVFAAGDARRGQSLVVWAIAEGRECARKVDQFLSGLSLLPTKDQSILSA